MKIQLPKISKKIQPNANINQAFQDAHFEEITLMNEWFEKDMLEYGNYHHLEVRDCLFDHTYFDHLNLANGYLLDVSFIGCDLSNVKFDHTLFRRVSFKDCKLSGADFSESMLDHVLFDDCRMNYVNFSATKIKALHFKKCDLTYASIMECDLKKADFEQCNLTKAELLHSSLYQKDLSSCEIEGIMLSFDDLKGAIVSPTQALALSSLLGIQIKDE